MNKFIKIKKKVIGEGKPCFIIAEAGVNHNGSLKRAQQLVDVAVNAGCDAVKFQTFTSKHLVTKNAMIAPYAQKNMGKKLQQLEMLKKLELSRQDFYELKHYCDSQRIIFLSTPHSFDAIDVLNPLVPAFKFGSGDITNLPALRYAAHKHKPMILGTGMSTLTEVRHAVQTIKKEGNNQVILLHCTTNYPCPLNEVNLRAMLTMKNKLHCLVGYSDHTLGILASLAAVTLGAVVIEKHITLDTSLPGPDHKASLSPEELKHLVLEIRNMEQVLGSSEKKPTPSEQDIVKHIRKSLVANRDIPKSKVIRPGMIGIKRPGTGLHPAELPRIIGKKTTTAIRKDEILRPQMIQGYKKS